MHCIVFNDENHRHRLKPFIDANYPDLIAINFLTMFFCFLINNLVIFSLLNVFHYIDDRDSEESAEK